MRNEVADIATEACPDGHEANVSYLWSCGTCVHVERVAFGPQIAYMFGRGLPTENLSRFVKVPTVQTTKQFRATAANAWKGFCCWDGKLSRKNTTTKMRPKATMSRGTMGIVLGNLG